MNTNLNALATSSSWTEFNSTEYKKKADFKFSLANVIWTIVQKFLVVKMKKKHAPYLNCLQANYILIDINLTFIHYFFFYSI